MDQMLPLGYRTGADPGPFCKIQTGLLDFSSSCCKEQSTLTVLPDQLTGRGSPTTESERDAALQMAFHPNGAKKRLFSKEKKFHQLRQ